MTNQDWAKEKAGEIVTGKLESWSHMDPKLPCLGSPYAVSELLKTIEAALIEAKSPSAKVRERLDRAQFIIDKAGLGEEYQKAIGEFWDQYHNEQMKIAVDALKKAKFIGLAHFDDCYSDENVECTCGAEKGEVMIKEALALLNAAKGD